MQAVHAFVGWLSTIVVYVVFLSWAFIPEPILHYYGITYYPSHYFAIALPSYSIVFVILLFTLYIGTNMLCTFPPDDMRTIIDSHSVRCVNDFVRINPDNVYSTPEIGDMNLTSVSDNLLAKKVLSTPYSLHSRSSVSRKSIRSYYPKS